jgi:transcriptional regulator with XRE-family HTH domain
MQELLDQLTGSNLKEKRENLLLTQEELAREIGVTKLAVSQWENSKAKPSKRHLRALKTLFDTRKEA